jgi:hypothetical protein
MRRWVMAVGGAATSVAMLFGMGMIESAPGYSNIIASSSLQRRFWVYPSQSVGECAALLSGRVTALGIVAGVSDIGAPNAPRPIIPGRYCSKRLGVPLPPLTCRG